MTVGVDTNVEAKQAEEPLLLTAGDVAAMVRLSERSIWNLRHGGYRGFPLPIKIGRRSVRWRRTDVENWIEQAPPAG